MATSDESSLEIRLFGALSIPTSPSRRSSSKSSQTSSTISSSLPPKKDLEALRRLLAEDLIRRIENTGEVVDDAFLARWLMARGRSGPVSLAEHAVWRDGFVGQGGVSIESVESEIKIQKVCIQGLDARGRPVVLFIARRHRRAAESAHQTMRLLVAALDAAVGAADGTINPYKQIVCIFDLTGMQRGFDVALLKDIFEVLQKHYPEVLASLYFVNAPWIFYGIWQLVAPFISPKTKKKISFISGVNGLRELHQSLGRNDLLPKRLGGTAVLRPFGVSEMAAESGELLESVESASIASYIFLKLQIAFRTARCVCKRPHVEQRADASSPKLVRRLITQMRYKVFMFAICVAVCVQFLRSVNLS